MSVTVDAVRAFQGLRAVVIGDVMLDSYLEGSATRLCAEGPVPVVRKTSEERLPGGAANTAANLRALGADVMLIGVVGRDIAGALLRTALRDRGVEDSWLIEDGHAATLHKQRILADGQYVTRFDEGDTSTLGPDIERQVLALLDYAGTRADVLVVSDYCYGVLTDTIVARLGEIHRHHRIPLAVDSKDLRRFAEAGATIVTPNHLEAKLAVDPGAPYSGPVRLSEIERLGRRLIEAIDTEFLAVTMGADGVCLVDQRGCTTHIPAQPVADADDVGAGDSFLAATALGLAAGLPCLDAARIGIDAAGIAVAKRRTAVVRQQELLQRVSLREHSHRAADSRSALDEVTARVDAVRQAGGTIVFTNGVFDILHAGHVELLRQARALGDLLVVGVNSDRSARLLKGERRPINAEQDRLALVAALEPVDFAVLFDEETPNAIIRAVRPHIHVKGGDYAEADLPEADVVREFGGRVVILPLVGDHSTSRVIERIAALTLGDEREADA